MIRIPKYLNYDSNIGFIKKYDNAHKTTEVGRKLLKAIKSYIKENPFSVLYKDTDSITIFERKKITSKEVIK